MITVNSQLVATPKQWDQSIHWLRIELRQDLKSTLHRQPDNTTFVYFTNAWLTFTRDPVCHRMWVCIAIRTSSVEILQGNIYDQTVYHPPPPNHLGLVRLFLTNIFWWIRCTPTSDVPCPFTAFCIFIFRTWSVDKPYTHTWLTALIKRQISYFGCRPDLKVWHVVFSVTYQR